MSIQKWPKNAFSWFLLTRILKIIVSGTIYFRGPVGSMEGPRLVSDPMGVGSCVLRVPWYGFCCLECKNIAYIADFLWIRYSETPVWWGLRESHLKRPPYSLYYGCCGFGQCKHCKNINNEQNLRTYPAGLQRPFA